MLIGIHNFGNCATSAFDIHLSREYNYIKCDNMILEEIHAMIEDEGGFDTNKTVWGNTTLFLGEFQNSLECGNMRSIEGKDITHIAFLKRKHDSGEEWITLDVQPYDYDSDNHLYSAVDMLAYADDEYDYGVMPLIIEDGETYANALTGEVNYDSVTPKFVNLFITNGQETICLKVELDYGSTNHNTTESQHITFGRRFPIIQSFHSTDYANGQIKSVILSMESSVWGVLDNPADRRLFNQIKDFFRNNDSLLMKDGNGLKYIVHISDIKETGDKRLGNGLLEISFNWTQIGDALNNDDLVENFLLTDFSNYPNW